MGGRTIHDAWGHRPIDMTATGILAKSSNVGTLMIAQKVGANTFASELAKFGLGTKTGIELGGESPGVVPDAVPVVQHHVRQPADRPGRR